MHAVVSCTVYPCCKVCKVNAINNMWNHAKVNKVLSMATLATLIIGTSSGDWTVTMFSGIIEDLVKNVEAEFEGVSLTEKLLATPHKFYVIPKDVYSQTTILLQDYSIDDWLNLVHLWLHVIIIIK